MERCHSVQQRSVPALVLLRLNTADGQSATSLDQALVPQQQAKTFNSLAVNTQVAVPEARRRTRRDQILFRTQVQLKIVDKTENSAAAFRMEIIIGLSDDFGPGQAGNRRTRGTPGVAGWPKQLKRRHEMCGGGIIARHAVRRRRAGGEPRVFDAEIGGARAGAGKDRHEK